MDRPSWKHRRRVVFGALIFCAGAIGYLIGAGDDTVLHRAIAEGLAMLAAGIIGSYVFGAAWDDRNVMVHGDRVHGGRATAPVGDPLPSAPPGEGGPVG